MDWSATAEAAIFTLSCVGLCVSFWVKSTASATAQVCAEEAVTNAIKGEIPTLVDTRIERSGALLYARINDLETRAVRLESAVADLPRGRDLHAIALQVSEMLGEMRGMRGELHNQTERFKRHEVQLDRLEQWAIEAAKEKPEGRS